jgi:hypothetical protein
MNNEFILTQDGDCHWFVIPFSRQPEWEKLTNLEEFEIPEWAEEVGGSPSLVRFRDYSIR